MQTWRHSPRIAALGLLLGGCTTWLSASDAASGPVAISAPTSSQAPFEVAPFKQTAAVAPSLATEDFLSVMSSSGEYLAMVEASRAWRQVRQAMAVHQSAAMLPYKWLHQLHRTCCTDRLRLCC